MQYTRRACGLGLDVICDSCEVCGDEDGLWASAAMRKHCQQEVSYLHWEQANCCINKAGRRVLCSELLGYKGKAVDAEPKAAREGLRQEKVEKEGFVSPFLEASQIDFVQN